MTRKLVAASSITLTAVLGAGTVPASASTHPVVVYANGMGGNWRGTAVRPSKIVFGSLWGFAGTGNINKPGQLHPVHWTHWTARSAYGSGQYFAGACECHSPLNVDYPADIALTDVQHRGPVKFFRDATITARGHHAVRLWYGAEHTKYGWIVGWHYPGQYDGLPPGAWFASSTVACGPPMFQPLSGSAYHRLGIFQ